MLSLIDRYWDDRGRFFVRLPETKDLLYIEPGDKTGLTRLIRDAHHNGMPLWFVYENNRILSCRHPSGSQATRYLSTFNRVAGLDRDSIQDHANIRFNSLLFPELRKQFFKFLKDSVHICRNNFPIDFGCEARAGVIARFLSSTARIPNYKLFLDGHIGYACRGKTYQWLSHTLNLLPLRTANAGELYVFDPFTLDKLTPLDTFMDQMKHISGITYHITRPDVLVSYYNSGRGQIDRDYAYSSSMFTALYKP